MIKYTYDEHRSYMFSYMNRVRALGMVEVLKWYPSNWLEFMVLLSDGTLVKYLLLNEIVSYPNIHNITDILDMSEADWRSKYFQKINMRRYYVGMIQESLASSSDISLTSVNKYFTCTATPSLYNATKLARVMKASLSEFQIYDYIRVDFDEVNRELDEAIDIINARYPDIVEDLKSWYPIISQNEIMLITHNKGPMFIFDIRKKRITLTVYHPDQPKEYISPTEWCERFSAILRDKMDECEITQTRLADMIGVSQAIVSRYIKGDAIPSLYLATKMASVFNCSLTDFHIQP